MEDAVTLPLILFPIIFISTLSIILHDLSNLIVLLLCILLAHNNIIATDTTSIGNDNFQCETVIMLSYVPVILSIAEARMSGSSYLLSQIFSRNPNLKIVLKSTIPASLTLIYGSIVMMKVSPMMQDSQFLECQLIIFIASWVTYTIISFLRRRKSLSFTRNASSFMGAVDFRNDLIKPDDRNWEFWDTFQLIEWVKYNYRDRCDDIDGDDMNNLFQAIKSQRIQGSSLPYLGVEDFRSIGLSYGDSVTIFHDICDLMHNFPSRNRRWDARRSIDKDYTYRRNDDDGDPANSGIDLDAWLGKKIGQANLPTEEEEEEESTNAQYDRQRETTCNPKRLSTDHSNSEPPERDNIFTSPSPPAAGISDTSCNVELDKNLTNAMPPNVREIVARRPDLVQALLATKNSVTVAPDDATKFESDPISFQTNNSESSVPGSSDLYRIEEESNEEGNWFSGECNDHEMLGLLRRRGKTE